MDVIRPVGFEPRNEQASSQNETVSAPPPESRTGPFVSQNQNLIEIGLIVDISGSGSKAVFFGDKLLPLTEQATDSCLAMSGQVGGQIKIRVGSTWLLANVRTLSLDTRSEQLITASIDYLGEGDEERLTGKVYNFRRGITRFPAPGTPVYAVTSDDVRQMYAAEDKANIEVDIVHLGSIVDRRDEPDRQSLEQCVPLARIARVRLTARLDKSLPGGRPHI